MKQSIIAILIAAVCLVAFNASAQDKKKAKGNSKQTTLLQNKMDTISYIIGADIGANLKKSNIDVKAEALVKGLTDAAAGIDTLISDALKQKYIMDFQNEMQAKAQQQQGEEAAKNKLAGEAFLEMNKKNADVKVTASGLQYKILKEGNGPQPKATDEVEVNYEGKLIDGKVFDSSYERGQPVSFPLNQVIPGWTEGVQLMKQGSTFEFYIPSALAYGEQGSRSIPGNSTLIFKVELLNIKAPAPAEQAPIPGQK